MVRTPSLNDAEDASRRVCGLSEIDYERRKAGRMTARSAGRVPPDVDEAVRAFEHDAFERGIEFVTFRRIVEAFGLSGTDSEALRRHLRTVRPNQDDWPLWSTLPRSVLHAR